jgi:hypothetical protein
MLTLFQRLLVLAALMFWQGGFTFYAAIVVPVGQEELGSHLQQGFITRQVTNYLNLSGAAALVLLAWDVWTSRDRDRVRRFIRWGAWAGMVVLLIALVILHRQLEQLLDIELRELIYAKAFRSGHRWYLWLSTVQWALGLTYVICTLAAWRAEDQIDVKSLPEKVCGDLSA